MPGFRVANTFRRQYGKCRSRPPRFWIRSNDLEYGRKTQNTLLEKLCQKRLQSEEQKPTLEPSGHRNATAQAGFVYPKYSPSLRLYKIGKANDPDKRSAGISLLLRRGPYPRATAIASVDVPVDSHSAGTAVPTAW